MAFEIPGTVKTLNNLRLLHEWAGPFDGATEAAAKTAANEYIPSGARLIGLEVTLRIAGVPKKYWYGTGVQNSDLIPMPAGSSLAISDEGTSLTTGATSINFTGAGVTATASGTDITVTIPGGGSGSPGGNNGYVQFNSNSSFGGDSNFFWNNTNKYLGIGTSSPVGSLHVNGSTIITGTWNSNNANGLHFGFGSNIGIIYSLQNGAAWRRLDIEANPLVLNAQSGGNVGIGTTSPAYKLQVSGSVSFPSLPGATQTNVIGYDTTTGELSYQTAGGGGGGSTNVYDIDLSTGNYLIQHPGIYRIVKGTDSNGYKISFDNISTNFSLGDTVTIVNLSEVYSTNNLGARIEPGSNYIVYQGGSPKTTDGPSGSVYSDVKLIPSGMTYVFEVVNPPQGASFFPSYWMCHPTNTEPFYSNIILRDDDNAIDYPLYILNHGYYSIVVGSRASKDAEIFFPDPKEHIGKKITIFVHQGEHANIDANSIVFFPGFIADMSITSPFGKVSQIPSGSCYTFLAVPKQLNGNVEVNGDHWQCISTFPNTEPLRGFFSWANSETQNYVMTTAGFYYGYDPDLTFNTYGLVFPDAGKLVGQTITILYLNNTYSVKINFVQSYVKNPVTQATITELYQGLYKFTAFDGYWYLN